MDHVELNNAEDGSNYDRGDHFRPDSIRRILEQSEALPPAVVSARLCKTFNRILDQETLAGLTDPATCIHEDPHRRCETRQKALSPYLDKRLVCVLINLPGTLYTIEVDPECGEIVYWEWLAR